MPIQDRNLKVGTKLMGHYHKASYYCTVVEGEEGKIHCRMEDGREFKSLSAAGTAITGKACNGWAFWGQMAEQPKAEVALTTVQEAEAKGC